MIFFNYFSQRSSRIAQELRLLTEEFLEQLIELPAPAEAKGKGDGGREAA